jgi:predicted double-glycine peptidase
MRVYGHGAAIPAWSASINMGSGTKITVTLQSFKNLRDQHVVKHTYDYSCRAAALATLLTYGLGDRVT